MRAFCAPSTPHGPVVEVLEPRLLYSADAAPLMLTQAWSMGGVADQATLVVQQTSTIATQHTDAPILVVLDARVPQAQQWLAAWQARQAAGEPLQVLVLAPHEDGLARLTQALTEAAVPYQAVHIVSHGAQGRVELGASVLDAAALRARGGEIAAWSSGLTEQADLLLWGCAVGQGELGQRFVADLAALTSADVAASDDLTGGSALGGDWELERSQGLITHAAAPMAAPWLHDYAGVLVAQSEGAPRTATNLAYGSEAGATSTAGRMVARSQAGSAVVWVDVEDGNKVYLQRYDAAGVKIGEFAQVVSIDFSAVQRTNPTVAMSDAGHVLVMWSRYQDNFLFYRGITPDGTATSVGLIDRSDRPVQASVAFSAEGGQAVAVWARDGQLRAQRFDCSGSNWKVGVDFSISGLTNATHPDVVVANDGTFLVVSEGVRGDGSKGMWATKVSSTNQLNPPVLLSANTLADDAWQQRPAVALAADQRSALVAWVERATVAQGTQTEQRRIQVSTFDLVSGQIGAPIALESAAADKVGVVDGPLFNRLDRPSVAAVPAGGWVVTWERTRVNVATSQVVGEIVAQTLDTTGAMNGAAVRVSEGTAARNYASSVAAVGSQFTVAWMREGSSGRNTILMQDFSHIILPPPRLNVTAFDFSETADRQSFARLVARDSTLPETVRFALVGGLDAARFTLDPVTGALSWVSQPDFERPLNVDAAAPNRYQVQVRVSDDLGLFTNQIVTVQVLNQNDSAPVITSHDGAAVVTLRLNENDFLVTTVTATDPDAPGLPTTFTYDLSGADASRFLITAQGVLQFRAAPNFEQPVDVGQDNQYELLLTVSDGVNASATQRIVVQVQGVDEFSPVFAGTTTLFAVDENTSFVTRVQATDLDEPAQTMRYELVPGGHAHLFQIDANTGDLRWMTAPDYESLTESVRRDGYSVQVLARSGDRTVTRQLTIGVNPVNEFDPILNTPAVLQVDEGQLVVRVLSLLNQDVIAPDGSTEVIRYAIAGGAQASSFTVNDAGELRFVQGPDFEDPAAQARLNQYQVIIRTTDGERVATQTLTVVVQDVNEPFTLTNHSEGSFSMYEDVRRHLDGAFTVADQDLNQVLTVQIQTVRGVASLTVLDGLTISGQEQQRVYTGTVAALQRALESLSFVPEADYSGAEAKLTISVWDAAAADQGVKTTAVRFDVAPQADFADTFGLEVGQPQVATSLQAVRPQTTAGEAPIAAEAIRYQVTELPPDGQLTLGSRALRLGDTFTQADIDANRVQFSAGSSGLKEVVLDVSTWSPSLGASPAVRLNVAFNVGVVMVVRAPSDLSFGVNAGSESDAAAGRRGTPPAGPPSAVAGVFVTRNADGPDMLSATSFGGLAQASSQARQDGGGTFVMQRVARAGSLATNADASDGLTRVEAGAADAAGGLAGRDGWLMMVNAIMTDPLLERGRGTGTDPGAAGFSVSGLGRNRADFDQEWLPSAALGRPHFVEQLEAVREQATSAMVMDRTLARTAVAASASLSILYAAWLLRGGALLTSMLASMPSWRSIDPMPVLNRLAVHGDDESPEDSLRGMLKQRGAAGAPTLSKAERV